MKNFFLIPLVLFLKGFSGSTLAKDWNDVVGVFSENG